MIRIVFLSANPSNAQKLKVLEEYKKIYSKIRESEYRDRFELIQRHAISGDSLISTLLEFKPTIVHFSGHGFSGQGSNQGALIFQNQKGKAEEINPTTIARIFEKFKNTIRCIVLNACYSENQAKSIIEHIDCVIGMSNVISDEAAMAFATTFYQALGYERDLQDAFDLGCSQIEIARLSEETTPKLLTRPGIDPRSVFVDGKPFTYTNKEQGDAGSVNFDNKLLPIHEIPKTGEVKKIIEIDTSMKNINTEGDVQGVEIGKMKEGKLNSSMENIKTKGKVKGTKIGEIG